MAKKRSSSKVVKAKPISAGSSTDVSVALSKTNEQHNIPKRVEDFNRVKPSEAFGKGISATLPTKMKTSARTRTKKVNRQAKGSRANTAQ